MKEQNYANHRRLVPLYHYVLTLLLLATFVLAVINLVHLCCSCCAGVCKPGCCDEICRGIIFLLISISLMIIMALMRGFANKVQDRAIHAEENLRHFIMTGKPLDSRLTWGQIIALRFAGDEEYLALSAQAISNNMKPGEIKKAIKNWRADNHRC